MTKLLEYDLRVENDPYLDERIKKSVEAYGNNQVAIRDSLILLARARVAGSEKINPAPANMQKMAKQKLSTEK